MKRKAKASKSELVPVVFCEGPNCGRRIMENFVRITRNWIQDGDGDKLHDFCSNKCSKEYFG